MIIGVSGKKRHGKGTISAILQAEYGFLGVDFADSLRGDMAVLNPIVGQWGYWETSDEVIDDKPAHGFSEPITYNQAIGRFGYERAKEEYPEIVRLLQVYGTDVGRDRIDTNLWCDRWSTVVEDIESTPGTCHIVVSDVRFQSEVSAIADRWWGHNHHFIGVVRPGYIHDPKADGHKSEILPELPGEKCTIIEASTVESLTEQLHIVMERLGFTRSSEHTHTKGS